jgi:hypothetical protein
MRAPKQITLRHPSPELTRKLKALSEARGESLNATILDVLERALGVEHRRARLQLAATWTEDDAAQFDAALREQRKVDAELWG